MAQFEHRSLLSQSSYQTTLARVQDTLCGEQRLEVVERSSNGR